MLLLTPTNSGDEKSVLECFSSSERNENNFAKKAFIESFATKSYYISRPRRTNR